MPKRHLEWLGPNPEDSEDSAEVIDSSNEGGEEEEESDEDAPEDGADGQPQPDRASSNDPRLNALTAVGGGQAKTDQPPAPPTDAADSAVQPSTAPNWCHRPFHPAGSLCCTSRRHRLQCPARFFCRSLGCYLFLFWLASLDKL